MSREQNLTPDDRLAERRPVFLNARCRQSSWVVRQVELADISEGGCRIVGDAKGLSIGQPVTLRMGSETAVEGHVRWIKDGDAGVEFIEAADPFAIADLAATYSIAGANVADMRKYR